MKWSVSLFQSNQPQKPHVSPSCSKRTYATPHSAQRALLKISLKSLNAHCWEKKPQLCFGPSPLNWIMYFSLLSGIWAHSNQVLQNRSERCLTTINSSSLDSIYEASSTYFQQAEGHLPENMVLLIYDSESCKLYTLYCTQSKMWKL